MKTDPLLDLFRTDLHRPLLSPSAPTDVPVRWIGPMVLRQPSPADAVRPARVLEMQARIEAGSYEADPDEMAEGMLEAIAPARRH